MSWGTSLRPGAQQEYQTIGHRSKQSMLECKMEKYDFTPTQLRLASLVAEGLTNKEIAERIHLKEKTVRNYLVNLYGEFYIKNRAHLASVYCREFEATGKGIPLEHSEPTH